ncbi:MAG: LysM repeat protein, partial [Planctomycetota bacterium]
VDGNLSVKAASPAIIVHREISEAEISDDRNPLLISQNYFLHHDRYEQNNGENIDKFVDGEFLVGAVYGCQVVATNPSSGKQKLELLVQIPRGAVPVLKSRMTRSQRFELEPYRTQTFEYSFYFPKPSENGEKNIGFPAHLARDEAIAAWADAREFDVVAKFGMTDTAGWDYISQHGTPAEVIGHLQAGNTSSLQLDRIAWRMQDIEFFRETLALLRTRHTYDHTLYSYGIYHAEVSVARQFLMHSDSFLKQCGASLVSTLVTVDPVERGTYQHLEYSPLVNARAHRLGRERKIANPQLHSQYHQFLRVLRYIPQPDEEDRLALAYYLLLQDRVAAGLGQLAKVDINGLPGKIQHDYFLCHAAFFRENPTEARRIAKKYRDYPVDRWRERFGEVLAQVDEILGDPVAVKPADNSATTEHPDDGSERAKAQGQLADTEPSISVKVETDQVTVGHQNLSGATVNYYEMDLEFLFSSNPFVGSGGAERFSIIKPNLSAALEFGGKKGEKTFMLPEEFRATNVLVEVVSAGQKVAQAYYAHTLDVTVVENYGRLDVRDAKTRKPLSKAYVKVYVRDQGGTVKFYKDGYTDLRGKFDYVSLNTNQLGTTQRFAILVMTEKNGSLVKEVATPFRGRLAPVNPAAKLSIARERTPTADPITEPERPVVGDMRRHIVHSGDTVPKIAQHFGITPEEIYAVNRIDELYQLYQGRVLRIPVGNRTQSLPPYAEAVPGKYGLVYSPFVTDKKDALVNVTDENNVPLPPGTEVTDPHTGKLFRVP